MITYVVNVAAQISVLMSKSNVSLCYQLAVNFMECTLLLVHYHSLCLFEACQHLV